MNLAETIVRDKEIQELKAKYKEMYGENAPPYCVFSDAGIDAYKEKLKKLIEAPEK